MIHLARLVRRSPSLYDTLQELMAGAENDYSHAHATLLTVPGGGQLVREMETLLSEAMDVTYGGERLADRPLLLLSTLLQMAQVSGTLPGPEDQGPPQSPDGLALERRLLEAVGPAREEETEPGRRGRVCGRAAGTH